MEDEKNIIFRLIKGDNEAFGEIILKHQDFVFNVVKNIVHIEEQAKDITQEVFLKAYENIEKFRGDSKISSWLYRIAYNLSINWSERKKDREIQADEETLNLTILQEEPYDKIFEKQAIIETMDKIIEELPDKYKIVVKLYYFEEKSYEEIADILGIPINTVRTHLLRAKKLIEKKLSER